MTTKDLTWLRTRTAKLVNFNIDEPDEDFEGTTDNAWEEIDDALNEAVDTEYAELTLNIDPLRLSINLQYEWPIAETTFTLPSALTESAIQHVYDVTDGYPGTLLWVMNRGVQYEPAIFPESRNVWRWGSEGPGSTRTLQFTLVPPGPELVKASDEPHLVPRQFRRLLVWSAACILRMRAEDDAPVQWLDARDRFRERLVLWYAGGSPRATNQPQFQPHGGGDYGSTV
jgi:hypothetical protein